jgi:chemotaxis protein CheD
MKIITIGIAESRIAKSPDKLVTLGLGSCVGLVLYDPVNKISGMIHIMLPTAPGGMAVTNINKFADTGIVELIRTLVAAGALRSRLVAKAAGGAHMFNSAYNNDVINVGQRNVEMCRKILRENGISVVAEDTGGTSGRSIEFSCESSKLQIRTVSPRNVREI